MATSNLAATLRERSLDRLDRLALVGPEPGIVEGLLGKSMAIGIEVLCELFFDVLWAEPFGERARRRPLRAAHPRTKCQIW